MGMPANASEQRAMITVVPAKTTAPPAVATDSGDRRLDLDAVLHLQLVARDDEERVVDPHPQADHGSEGRGDGGHLERVPEHADDRQGAGDAEQRRDDRDDHRHGAAEREQKDDDRRADPDDLADVGGWLGHFLPEVAAGGDLDVRLLGDVGIVDDRVRLVDVEVRLTDVQGDRDVPDRLVLVERGLALRVERADHPDDVRVLPERLDRIGHGGAVGRISELALGRLEHDGVGPVRLVGKPLLEQVDRLRRARAGQRQVVRGQRAGDARGEHQHHRQGDPCADDPPVAAGAEPGEFV